MYNPKDKNSKYKELKTKLETNYIKDDNNYSKIMNKAFYILKNYQLSNIKSIKIIKLIIFNLLKNKK